MSSLKDQTVRCLLHSTFGDNRKAVTRAEFMDEKNIEDPVFAKFIIIET
jgi:hypothetical protein